METSAGPYPPMAPKLDLILRRLIWLNAPKEPRLQLLYVLRGVRLINGFGSFVQSAQVFVVCILLLGHLSFVDPEKTEHETQYEILEFYAGQARLAKMASALGVPSAATDFLYDDGDNKHKNNSMDMCTSAGFLLLIWNTMDVVQPTLPGWLHLSNLRLACTLVLQGRWEDFIALMGICCSTFVSMSRGSTHRSEFLPVGCPISIAVYKANKGLVRWWCQRNLIYSICNHFHQKFSAP